MNECAEKRPQCLGSVSLCRAGAVRSSPAATLRDRPRRKGRRRVWALLGSILIASGALPAATGPVVAQENPDAHSAHHAPAAPPENPAGSSAPPGSAPTSAPQTPAASPPTASSMGGMGEMMRQPQKQFYPSLMDMPTLSAEARQFIEQEAQQRLGAGSQSITTGESDLHHAMAMKDPAAIQKAAASVREGLLRVESAAAALRAVNEGQAPHQIALDWFKRQLSLPTANQPAANPGPLGLSWYHLTAMVFLAIFVGGALLIHFTRMRRTSGLVQRLANRATQSVP